MDRGDPFGLLGYEYRWLELERVRRGPFGADFGSLFARAVPNDLPNLTNFNFNICNII